jgi:hypothetical protein
VSAEHLVTADWGTGESWPTLHLACKAPDDAICHAVWDCECEQWGEHGVDSTGPWHEHAAYDVDPAVRHYGRFDKTECNLVNWFDNSEEMMRGSISFPVAAEFDGDYYTFTPEAAS